jgi:hypothetical protein
MLPLPTRCPFSGGEIVITQFFCPDSGLKVEGEFSLTVPFAQLTPEQVQFVETFVRCEGKFNRMENELGLSYPTLRTRLHEVIHALGYEPGKEEPPVFTEAQRRRVLEELNAGQLGFEEAMQLLKGESAWDAQG